MTAEQTYSGYWLFTQGTMLALEQGNLPYGCAEKYNPFKRPVRQIGQLKLDTAEAKPVWLVVNTPDAPQLPATLTWHSLRTQLARPADEFDLLGRGITLNHFFSSHYYCGHCATPTQITFDEFAVHCPKCNSRHYPVICPCIIVAVRKDDKILLANHQRHKGKMYTVLAGFVEAGETFEQAVKREVFEESGLKVDNIRYVASQPWAFPNSLMVGYLADYVAGEIQLQADELYDANWFRYDQPLPELPETGTIARQLIELTLTLCRATAKNSDPKY